MGKQLPDDKNSKWDFLHRGDKVWYKMAEHLFDTCKNFHQVYPEAIQRQRLKRCMMELSSQNEHDAGEKLMSTLKTENTKYSKNL